MKDKHACPGHDSHTDCEIDPQNPCEACNQAEDQRLSEALYQLLLKQGEAGES